MNHKRKGPKSTRSGCLCCKPHKRQGSSFVCRMTTSTRRKAISASEQLRSAGLGKFDRGLR